jgi:hypothetical protein
MPLVTCSVDPSCFGHFLFSWVEIGGCVVLGVYFAQVRLDVTRMCLILLSPLAWFANQMTSVHLTVSFVQHPLT